MYMARGSRAWKYTFRGSYHLVVAHAWKYTSGGSTRIEVHVLNAHNSQVIIYLPSLSHYITPISQHHVTRDVMHRLFSMVHIKT